MFQQSDVVYRSDALPLHFAAGNAIVSYARSGDRTCHARLREAMMASSWIDAGKGRVAGALPNVNAPVLVLHSPRDDIIAFSHGKKLYEAAREPKQSLTQ